jgi:hypothetical protein
MYRLLVFVATAMLPAVAASAEEPRLPLPTPEKYGWQCGNVSSLYSFTFSEENVVLNNVSISEEDDYDNPSFGRLELSFSVANRTDRLVGVSLHLIGYDAENVPVIAISASAPPGYVQPFKTGSVSSTSFVDSDTIFKITTFCLLAGHNF